MPLRLRWPDERYVRVYCRDTPEWLILSWAAKALYVLLLRKADRAGRIRLGRAGTKGVAALLGHVDLWSTIEPALDELLADGCIQVSDGILQFSDFVDAQEAVSSGRLRTQKWREKRGMEPDGVDLGEALRDASSLTGDEALRVDEKSPDVTPGYSTARQGTAQTGTAQHGQEGPGEGRPPLETRILAALPGPAYRVAERVWVGVAEVERALLSLEQRGLVRSRPSGNPPVSQWEAVT